MVQHQEHQQYQQHQQLQLLLVGAALEEDAVDMVDVMEIILVVIEMNEMDGIGSGFVGYSIPGVPTSLKEWIRPSLRYDLSYSTCHVNPPGGEMMSDHYGCRVVLPLDTPLLLFLLGYHTGAHPPGGCAVPHAIHTSVPGETPVYTIPTVPYRYTR
eukprot:CAMPEP_0170995076 /NCGR_PEP_ID=MMETSP0736-20130129/11376_1 /TAXON_ID=186038 /ORGANISM="Fragilariopsis kerguelensis, Strain L26-C5" /LENGTH=155 /DNA_ID=CAMNT_0011421161 /DNA_START=267 /DNA_END=735 /DNA_ORIENTATION=+